MSHSPSNVEGSADTAEHRHVLQVSEQSEEPTHLDAFSHATYDCRPVGEHYVDFFCRATDSVHLHPTIGEQELDDASVTCE